MTPKTKRKLFRIAAQQIGTLVLVVFCMVTVDAMTSPNIQHVQRPDGADIVALAFSLVGITIAWAYWSILNQEYPLL